MSGFTSWQLFIWASGASLRLRSRRGPTPQAGLRTDSPGSFSESLGSLRHSNPRRVRKVTTKHATITDNPVPAGVSNWVVTLGSRFSRFAHFPRGSSAVVPLAGNEPSRRIHEALSHVVYVAEPAAPSHVRSKTASLAEYPSTQRRKRGAEH